MTRTQSPVEQLERDLRGTDVAPAPDLVTLHRLGSRRRRHRRAGVAAGGVLAGVLVVGSLAVTGVVDTTARDVGPAGAPSPATTPTPEAMRPLTRRVLEEIPGAVQVSSTQVVVPGPAGQVESMVQPVPDDLIEVGPVDVGAHSYAGVTAFGRRAFPTWLRDGVEQIEQGELASDDGSFPLGSTDMGILVDGGELRLGCVHSLPDWGGNPDAPCAPAMLSGSPDTGWGYAWGMGTEDFLVEGKPLELFSTDDYSTGSPRELWIGGTDGTDVASVELVGVDGERVQADVAPGDLVAGETMFWGAVTEDLAMAITRDADGDVLERHEVKPCRGGVDCEVR